MVGGLDQRLPVNIARLNKHRVPANAIIFQTIVAVIFTAVIYIVVPFFTNVGDAATLNSDIYNVVISASTLVWAISTAFIFIDLEKCISKIDKHSALNSSSLCQSCGYASFLEYLLAW